MTRYAPTHEYQYRAGNSARTRSSGCTWITGAVGADAATGGRIDPSPDAVLAKVKRTEESSPATPGWSLADLDLAMRRLGVAFDVRTGWTGVKAAHDDGYYVALQGDSDRFGNSTCSGAFDGDHCIGIRPGNDARGYWPIDDPICRTARYEHPDTLRRYAVDFSSLVRFGVFLPKVPVLIPDTSEEPMKSFPIPEEPSVVTVKAGAWLYTESDLGADADNVKVSVTFTTRYIGKASDAVLIVGYDRSPAVKGKSALYVKASDTQGIAPAIPATARR